MTAQNETLFKKITQLEQDNISLLKALHHAECYRSASEQQVLQLERFIASQGLSNAKDVFMQQVGNEGDVSCLTQYMGSMKGVEDDEYDEQCHRSLYEHKERQEAYKVLEEDM